MMGQKQAKQEMRISQYNKIRDEAFEIFEKEQ